MNHFDVIVVGGGHAACEAALASARTGASTLLLTLNLDHIAQMSCNPCIGGVAKGHLVREIDALGGAMGEVADASGIQFRMLNLTKGPAVWSPRAQCDKVCYQRAMKNLMEHADNLMIRQGEVIALLTEGNTVIGVRTHLQETFYSKSTVIATGTFLRGKLHYGLMDFPGGRAGDPPSVGLSESLRSLGLHMGRLKTGTPPRLLDKSIDFSKMSVQENECSREEWFSNFGTSAVKPCVSDHDMVCYITRSTAETAALVKANLDKAPMYNGLIEGIGTRYCPSFEDKVVRFPQHEEHHLYLEPEGEATGEYYLNGMSTSLPPEIQVLMVHSVPGLEHAVISRYAYAIEYDFVYPEELDRTFAVRKYSGLYHAGQINGTSGYEEAAAQGLAAGLNAARHAAGLSGVEFGRDETYIGVLIDDLVTKEIVEPYRLFTSRAEFRLRLRQDNADLRLARKAHDLNLLPAEKFRKFEAYERRLHDLESASKEVKRPGGRTIWDELKDMHGRFDFSIPDFPYDRIQADPADYQDRRVLRELAVEAHYEGYLRQEDQSVIHLHTLENWKIPESLDYAEIPGLRNEARMKLSKIKPSTLAQAGRIDGVTPAEIGLLQVHIARINSEQKKQDNGGALHS